MIENRIETYKNELAAMRHDLHMHPELQFEEVRTGAIVARELARYGYEVTAGVAGTGVVGTLKNGSGSRAIVSCIRQCAWLS